MSHFHRVSRAYSLALSQTPASATHQPSIGSVYLRLVSTAPCWVQTEQQAAPAVGAGLFLPANFPLHLRAYPGETVGVVGDAGVSSGTLNIAEMEP